MTREPTAEELALTLADRMTAHIMSGGAVAYLPSLETDWVEIKTAVADGRDVIANGTDRLRVHGDSGVNNFATYWWTPWPGVVPALMRERP